MKKLFLLFAVLGLFTLTANAQKATCGMKTAESAKVCTKSMAAKVAAQDDTIEERVCAKSGTVGYVKKNVCAASGNVSYVDVTYHAESGKFVNVSPSAAMGAKAVSTSATAKPACSKPCAKTCTKGAKAATTKTVSAKAVSTKKSCAKKCAKSGKSCTKGANAAAPAKKSNAQLVKMEE